MADLPKSYLKPEDREGLTQNGIYLAESSAALDADDVETSWAWLRFAKLPASALLSMKLYHGSEYVREKGLDTTLADEEYGDGWLDR